MALLHPGDRFPELTVQIVGGGRLELPAAFAGGFGVVLFNRGSWCPYCSAQLRAFERSRDAFDEEGIRLVSLSVDDEPTAAALVEKLRLGFPVGFGADALELAELTGAFVNPDPVFVQSTGFILDPEGKVSLSVYSSGAIGRLVPEDVLGLIRMKKKQSA